MSKPPILAAGGVVWRRRQHAAEVEVALVHRAKYQDWTLPKGKLESGERSLLAAVREVGEETGASVRVGRRLISSRYSVGEDTKTVSYWSMHYVAGEHTPSSEVDQIAWLSIEDAQSELSYAPDRAVLRDFAALPPALSMLLLIRHAKAGKRVDFKGDDRSRPLDKIGRRQARDCAPFLAAFGPTQIISAEPLRCRQTVEPLAGRLGLAVLHLPELSDASCESDPDATLKATLDVLDPDVVTVACSQGGTIPALLSAVGVPGSRPSRKGSLWVLGFDDARLVSADYYPRPQI